MYLKKSTNKKNGRTQLTIAESYRSGKISKTRVIRNLGYLDLLQKDYDDPMGTYYDEVLKVLGKELGIDFSRKYRTLKEIKNELALTKKPASLE